MNEMEIEEAVHTYRNYPVLGLAARFLDAYKNHVNQISDGWCYWHCAANAAQQLCDLFRQPDEVPRWQKRPDISEEQFRKSLVPIKSFCTKYPKKYPNAGLRWDAFAYVLPLPTAKQKPEKKPVRKAPAPESRSYQQASLFPL